MFLIKTNSVFGFKVQEFFSDSGLTVDHGDTFSMNVLIAIELIRLP